MKILLASDTYLPLLGGGETHVRELLTHLRAQGHDVRLFTNQEGSTDDEAGIVRVPWSAGPWAVFRAAWKLIGDFRPDVVGTHYSYALAAVTGLAARLRGVPVTVTLHGLGTVPMPPGASLRARALFVIYQRLSLGLAGRVIATSQDMLDAVPYVARKTVMIPNGASADTFDPDRVAALPASRDLRERAAGRKVLLTVRRLNPKCGIQYLVEAMPEIVRRHPDVLWLMVGIGSLESRIRSRVRELGLEGHVEMVGAVQNTLTPPYFSVADVVAFPSTAESTSISCIEAMLMGKAVVASSVGGLIELLGRDGTRGRLVKLVDWEASNYDAPPVPSIPPERFLALATAVSELLSDDEARRRIGAAARARALERYEWKHLARRTVDEAYRQAMSRTHADPRPLR